MENIRKYIKNSIIGLLAGIVSGLFSTGGGMILVPAFIHLLKMEDTQARGTSIFCILPMVITTSFFYYKGHYIEWKTAILCGMLGGYIGARLLKKLPTKILKIAFTIFLIYASYKMWK